MIWVMLGFFYKGYFFWTPYICYYMLLSKDRCVLTQQKESTIFKESLTP